MAFVNSYIRWLLLFLLVCNSVATEYSKDVVAPAPGLDSLLQQFVASAEQAGIEFSPKCKTLSVDERQPLTYLDEAVGTLSKTRGLHSDGSVYPSSSILYSVTPPSPEGETCSISLMWNNNYNGTNDLIQSDNTEAFYLASKLISIITYNASEDVVANGNTSIHFPPEEIHLKRNGIFTRGFTKPVCTHVDSSTNSFTQEGCQTDASEPRNGVSCICNTGTSFALMTDVTIMLTNQRALVIVLCVGIAVSIFCLIFLITGTCIFKRLKYLPERHIFRSLAVALIFSNIALLCDTVVDWRFTIQYPNLVTLAVHFSLLSVCMWLFILILDFAIRLKIDSCRSNTNTCFYQTLGWGLPILIAGLSAGLLWDYYADDVYWPWLDPGVVYVWTVVGPILILLLLSFLMLLTLIICRCLCDICRSCERCCDTGRCGDICRCCCDRPRKVTVYRTEHRHRRRILLKAGVLGLLLIVIISTLIMGVMATRSAKLQYVFAVLNGCIGFVLLICVYLLSKDVEREYVPSVVVDSSIHGQTLVDVQYDPEITVSGYRRDYVNEGFEMTEHGTSQEPGQTQLSRKKYTKVFYTDGSSGQEQYYRDRRNEQVNIRYVDEQPTEEIRRRDVSADIVVERRPRELRERVDIEQDVDVVTGKYYKDSEYQQKSVGRKVIITEDQREPERIRGARSREEMDAEIMVERRPRELRERVGIEQDVLTGKYYSDSDYQQKSVGRKVIIAEDEQREPERIRGARSREEMDAEIMVERRPRELRERVDIEQDVVTGKYYRDSNYQQKSVGRKVITEDEQREPERIRGARSREEIDAEIMVERRPRELRERVGIEQDVLTGKYYSDSDYQQKSVGRKVIIAEDEQREPERIRGARSREEMDAEIMVERRPRELRERVGIEQDVLTGKYYSDSDYQQKSVGRKVIIAEDEQREPERIRGARSREEMDAEIMVERRPRELRERVDIEQDVVTGKYYRDSNYQQKSVGRKVITEDEQREPERIRGARSREEIDAEIMVERRPRELRERVGIEQDVLTGKYYSDSDYQQKSVGRKVIIAEDEQREPERIRGARSREEMDAEIMVERRPRELRERVDIEQEVVTQQESVERKMIISEDEQREPEYIRETRSQKDINADILIERRGVDMVPKQPKRYASSITLQGTDIFETLRVEKLFELESYLESRVPSRFDDRKMKFIIQDFGSGLTQLARYLDEPSLSENIPVDRPFEAYIVNGDGCPVVDRPFMFHYDRDTNTYCIVSTRRFSQPEKYYASRERIEYARPKETLEEFTDKTNMQKLPKFKRIENYDLENENINGLDIIQLIIPYPDENRYDIRYMTRCKEGPWDTVSLPENETYVEAIIVERDGTLERLVILKYEDKNTYSIVQSNTDIGQLRRSARTEEEYTKIERSPIKQRKPVFKRLKKKFSGKDQKKQRYISVKREESLQRPQQQEVVEINTTSITTDDRRQPVERRREFPERPRQQEFVERTTATTTIVPAEKTYDGEIRTWEGEKREKSPQGLRQQEYVEEVSSKTTTEERAKEPDRWVLQRRGESPRRHRQQEYIEETTTTTITDETTRKPSADKERRTLVGEMRRESPHRYRQQEVIETVGERAREPRVGEKRWDEKPSDGEIRESVDERRWEFPRRQTQPEYVETTRLTPDRTSQPVVKTFDGEIQPLVEEQLGESPQIQRQQEYEQSTTTTITDERERASKPWVGKRVSEYPSIPRRQEYIEITTAKSTVDENIREPAAKRPDGENRKWVQVGDRRWEFHKPNRQDYTETTTTETTTTAYDRKREPAAKISDGNIRTWVGQKPWESPRRRRQQDYVEKTTTEEETEEPTEKTFDGEIRTSTTTTTTEERPREPTARKPGGVWIGESRGYSPQSRRQLAYVERTTTTTETEEPTVETFDGEIRTRVGERQPEYLEKTTFTTTTTDKRQEEQPVKALVEEQLGEYPRQQRQQEYERTTTTTKPDYGEITLVFEIPKQEYVETTISTTKTEETREPDSTTSDNEVIPLVEERVGESPQRPRQEYVERSITTTKTEEEIKKPDARSSGGEIPTWVLERRGESPQRRRQEYVERSITTTKTEEEIKKPDAKPSDGEIPTWVLERRGESPQRPRQEYVERSTTTTKTEEIKKPDARPSGGEIPSWVLERRGESPQRPRQEYVERSITTTKTEEEIKKPDARPSDGEIPTWVLERRGESPQRRRQEYVEKSITTTKTEEEIKKPDARPSGGEIPSWVLERRGESPQRPRQEYVERSITTTKTEQEIKKPDARPSDGEIPTWVLERRGESPQKPRRQEYVEATISTTKTETTKEPDGEIFALVEERLGESPQLRGQEYVKTTTTTNVTSTADEGTEIKYEEDGVQRLVEGSSTTVQQIHQGSSDLQRGGLTREFISGTGDEYVSGSSSMAYGMTSESTRMLRSDISGAVSETVRDDAQVSGGIEERVTVTESRHTFRSHPSTESGQHRFRTEISGVVLSPRPPTSSFGSDVSSIVHDVTDDIKKSYYSFTESL